MVSQLYFRMASAAGLLALAFVLLGLDPFLSDPAAGTTPSVTVDRSLKGDRLPISNSTLLNAPDWRSEFSARPSNDSHAQMPVGCDGAFSSISLPQNANVYRRCMA
jgi:hypothetical protein